jgi:hypothetical protein
LNKQGITHPAALHLALSLPIKSVSPHSNHQPSAISHQPSTINHQPSTINHQPSTINHQPSTINHQPSTINHQNAFRFFIFVLLYRRSVN